MTKSEQHVSLAGVAKSSAGNMDSLVRVSAIAALAANRVIGKDNDIPWRGRVPGEQDLFKTYTMGKVVIMGRRTWESIPSKFRPLKNRMNIVVTRQQSLGSNVMCVPTIEEALLFASVLRSYDEAVLIGGQRIYEEGLRYCDTLYLTKLDAIFPGDTFFPEIVEGEWYTDHKQEFPLGEGRSIEYSFNVLRRLQ